MSDFDAYGRRLIWLVPGQLRCPLDDLANAVRRDGKPDWLIDLGLSEEDWRLILDRARELDQHEKQKAAALR